MSVVSKLSKFIKTSPKSNVRVEINIHKLLELLSGLPHIEKISQVPIKRSKGKFYNIAKNWAKRLKDISKNKLSSVFIAQDLAKILTIDGESIEYEALVKLLKDKNYRKSIANFFRTNNEYIITKEELQCSISENIFQSSDTIEKLLNSIETRTVVLPENEVNKINCAFYATASEKQKMLELLLKKGSHINTAGSVILLHHAMQSKKSETVTLLQKYISTDINSVDNKGHTFLHHAVECENLEIVKLLIKEGAKLNCVDLNGCTPLNLAIKSCNVEITNLLLNAGGDLKYTYKDSKGNITRVYTEDDYKFFLPLLKKRSGPWEKHEQNNHLNTTMHEPTTDQLANITLYS